ncbi:MAG: hypothetical protein KAQ70_04460 [Candidatus Heimdallarchaeota archaeon]|nr:hypothetical protein [Candidatus Heimdallarchaeota archaeon]
MTEEIRISFPYKGETLTGAVKRFNKKTVTVETDKLKFRVPYSLTTPRLKPPKQTSTKRNSKKKWSASQSKDYEKSKTASMKPLAKSSIKLLNNTTVMLGDSLKLGDDEAIKKYSNLLLSELNSLYSLPHLTVHTGGKRRLTRSGGQYYGLYRTRGDTQKKYSISIFSRTAKTQNYVAPKTFLRTLIHEWGHHYDRHVLSLVNTYHTKGFYDRINTLYVQLKEVLDKN